VREKRAGRLGGAGFRIRKKLGVKSTASFSETLTRDGHEENGVMGKLVGNDQERSMSIVQALGERDGAILGGDGRPRVTRR